MFRRISAPITLPACTGLHTSNTRHSSANDTPLLRKRGGAANVAALGRVNPSGRVGRPEEVASLVVKLAGDDVAFLTGEDVKIDGADSA